MSTAVLLPHGHVCSSAEVLWANTKTAVQQQQASDSISPSVLHTSVQ
jgi:hypothetical protein